MKQFQGKKANKNGCILQNFVEQILKENNFNFVIKKDFLKTTKTLNKKSYIIIIQIIHTYQHYFKLPSHNQIFSLKI